MRIHRHRHFKPKFNIPQYRVNEKIIAPEIRLIDDAGANEVLTVPAALARAEEAGLDLIEVSPKAVPPVCRLMDYGAFKYQKEKEMRKQRAQSKEVDVKGIRLSLRIGQGDLEIRKNQAVKFLEQGDKIRIELILRGREKAYAERAEDIMHTFLDSIREEMDVRIESPISKMEGRMNMIVAKNS
ncbi:MAG: translation initiation factor IF-3 [Patescibacteria group bacterium]|jgi:translation initiation factor IF-3